MNLKLMRHQTAYLAKAGGAFHFGCLSEQGTGKTVMLLAEAEALYEERDIEALLVVAPAGVHTNWTRKEIPEHLSTQHEAVAWRSGKKTHLKRLEEMRRTRALKILTMNFEAVNTKNGFAAALQFLSENASMFIVDESQRIKNPTAQRTKRILHLGRHADFRRISTGTPVTQAPPDMFSQFEFLQPGCLGTDSYRTFVARYAHLLSKNNPLVQHIKERARRKGPEPQVVAKDTQGRPRWRNLDQLRAIIEPISHRALKRECMDLPDKVYSTRFFAMDARQEAIYRELEAELKVEFDDVSITVNNLAALTKLQQVTSGFLLVDGEPVSLPADNPRLALLMDTVQDIEGQFIVWARFTDELRMIADALEAAGISCARYYADQSKNQKDEAEDLFQAGERRAFVGQPASGGIGITLTAAATVLYYSNHFNWETRSQSEDRAHRRGSEMHNKVLYIDLVAEGTVDERIATSLQHKSATAQQVTGDTHR